MKAKGIITLVTLSVLQSQQHRFCLGVELTVQSQLHLDVVLFAVTCDTNDHASQYQAKAGSSCASKSYLPTKWINPFSACACCKAFCPSCIIHIFGISHCQRQRTGTALSDARTNGEPFRKRHTLIVESDAEASLSILHNGRSKQGKLSQAVMLLQFAAITCICCERNDWCLQVKAEEGFQPIMAIAARSIRHEI